MLLSKLGVRVLDTIDVALDTCSSWGWGIGFAALLWPLQLLRSILKRFVHWSTGKCELERILERTASHASSERILRLERYFCISRELRGVRSNLVELGHARVLAEMITIKSMSRASAHTISSLRDALESIEQMATFHHTLKKQARTPFDTNNARHELQLDRLWRLLRPGVHLPARRCSAWQDIGFQGDDPATDFRGSGELGLNNLVAFAERYPALARSICSLYAQDALKWPSFAITGINLTIDALSMLEDRCAHSFMYRHGGASQDAFNELYCWIWYEFDMFWRAQRAASVMEFGRIHKEFIAIARARVTRRDIADLHKLTLRELFLRGISSVSSFLLDVVFYHTVFVCRLSSVSAFLSAIFRPARGCAMPMPPCVRLCSFQTSVVDSV